MNPEDRYYSTEHEWVLANEDKTLYIGITEYAQEELGDLVFVEMPTVGTVVESMGKLGEVESVKSVSDIYCPISGKVIEINQEAVQSPEIINEDPYGKGWLVRLDPSNPEDLNQLMSASEYETFLESLGH
ncbi:MAG: glycine cleavage system protein H [Chloroflexi bacterium]|nr:glycine cleavage system protein H [Chloroflexota bacterium]MQF99392.1 glycine cleavage system protein GcvH [SAR202 cluster bacterium]|tara:strand:- start:915 stop:1304 length:390 start_codon:yes stop_codon:yes gene_type:complete